MNRVSDTPTRLFGGSRFGARRSLGAGLAVSEQVSEYVELLSLPSRGVSQSRWDAAACELLLFLTQVVCLTQMPALKRLTVQLQVCRSAQLA